VLLALDHLTANVCESDMVAYLESALVQLKFIT